MAYSSMCDVSSDHFKELVMRVALYWRLPKGIAGSPRRACLVLARMWVVSHLEWFFVPATFAPLCCGEASYVQRL